jgi:hypothetical protein
VRTWEGVLVYSFDHRESLTDRLRAIEAVDSWELRQELVDSRTRLLSVVDELYDNDTDPELDEAAAREEEEKDAQRTGIAKRVARLRKERESGPTILTDTQLVSEDKKRSWIWCVAIQRVLRDSDAPTEEKQHAIRIMERDRTGQTEESALAALRYARDNPRTISGSFVSPDDLWTQATAASYVGRVNARLNQIVSSMSAMSPVSMNDGVSRDDPMYDPDLDETPGEARQARIDFYWQQFQAGKLDHHEWKQKLAAMDREMFLDES